MKKRRTFARSLILMLVVSAFAVLGYNRLYKNQSLYLKMIDGMYEEGEALNLDQNLSPVRLSEYLTDNKFIADKADADAIAVYLTGKVRESKDGRLRNLGQINTRQYRLPERYIDSIGGPQLRHRMALSRLNIGQDDAFKAACEKGIPEGVFHESDTAKCVIAVSIRSDAGLSVNDIPVRLKRHYYDSLAVDNKEIVAVDSVVTYLRTGEDGKAVFYVAEGNYSVVPIESGYEFGLSKGSTYGTLSNGKHRYSFNKNILSITAFDSETYRDLKFNDSLTVRTPSEYKNSLTTSFAALLLVWWLSFIVIGIVTVKTKDRRDLILIPLLMFLNIAGMLAIWGIPNPLTDRPLGIDMTYATVLGVVIMTLFSFIPVARMYASGYKVFGKRIPFEPIPKAIKGISYLLLSLLLICLLAFFGTAPEGSDAKINLFFLQPAELCKFLTVIFMAAFFAENATAIRKFSETANKVSLALHLRTISLVLLAIVVISLLYMCVVSDMGPALVLLVTFVFMYSFARRDFLQLLIGVASFVLICFLLRRIPSAEMRVLASAIIWLVLWIAGGLLIKKTIYESAIFFNALITLFVTGGSLLNAVGFHHQAARLQARMAMAGAGIWDNMVSLGGDQVAQAVWGYSTGGFWGQGLGLGNPNLIPAGHTDMMLASIGEQMGLLAVVMILCCFALVLYRCYSDGKAAGHPFSFYLASGIGSVSVIQFLIIALGSTGIIPLTGVAVPFLSYAKSSLVINLAAMGLIIALSKEQAGEYQQAVMDAYRPTLRYGMLSYMALSVVLLVTLVDYSVIHRDEMMLRPGLFANQTGVRAYHYNPRIKALENKLKVESVYDRNGLLLATSSAEEAGMFKNVIVSAGVAPAAFDTELQKRSQRYYPFGTQTFFMVGNSVTKTQWSTSESNPSGFNAENRFLARLRGFDNQNRDKSGGRVVQNIHLFTYRPDRFLPAIDYPRNRREMKYDYRQLLPLMKKGIAGHREIKNYEMDSAEPVFLTIDAELQTKLQARMSEYIRTNKDLGKLNKLRASVVVLDANKGDLLCSANYPLPQMEILDSLERKSIFVYNEKDATAPAYTDRDLGLTFQSHPGSTSKVMTAMAGYRKCGNKVASVNYDIDLYEIIENGRAKEPYSTIGGLRAGRKVDMTTAIEKSSNCYFVNLLADKDLYSDLGVLYAATGVRLDGHEGRGVMIPYFFYHDGYDNMPELDKELSYLESKSLANYPSYKETRRAGHWTKMNRYHGSAEYWGIAYGQGQLYASPLNMARIGSIVGANGYFTDTRYELGEKARKQKIIPNGTDKLAADMRKEADKHRRGGIALPGKSGSITVMSKTGTPERTWIYNGANGKKVEEKPNDGWYLCVVRNDETGQCLSIAVRLERLGSQGSKAAVRFTSDVVLPVLQQCGYNVIDNK